MEIRFLGGASTVTGSQFLVATERARVLIDCGMFQGSPNEAARNRVPFAYEPRQLDALILTHAHLDHCGLIPHLVAEGYRGPIHATKGTVELAGLVLLDSAKLQQEFSGRDARRMQRDPRRWEKRALRDQKSLNAALAEARVADGAGESRSEERDPERLLRSQVPEIRLEVDEPLYSEADVLETMRLFRPLEYGIEREIARGFHATLLDAGHILGSAIIRLRVREGDRETVIVFSGDLGRRNTPIIRDPTVMTTADYVVVESTYGGREHEPQAEATRILTETIHLVARNKGVLLVPSFAIGRTQEVVWQLDRLIADGAIPRLPLYLDSPMASKASAIYRRHEEYWDEETTKILAGGDDPLDYPGATITKDAEESKAIRNAPRPYMIVASNGMLTGGRVLHHLRNLIDDPAAVLLFVGYQGQGTLGAHLQAGAKSVIIDGESRDVRCAIRSISGFSAHADESELLEWLNGFVSGKRKGAPGHPRKVFVVHGDPDAQLAIAPKIAALGLEPHVPKWRERVTLR